MSDQETTGAPVKVQLTVSGILNDLNEGLTRDAIRTKYSLSAKDVSELFKHPKLKGKKTKPAPGFNLVDDTPEEVVAVAETPIVEDTSEPATTPDVTEEVANTPNQEWEGQEQNVEVRDNF
jgi:hypothetical protein